MTGPSALHVVHVCCTDAFAGVERHVSELAAEHAASGHQVTVIGGDRTRVREMAGPRVRVLPGHRVDVAVRSLRRLDEPADVVNTHMTGAELAAAVAGVRAPVVSTRHFASSRGNRSLTRPLVRWSTRRVDAQISVSQYVADRVDGTSTVVLSGVRPDPGLVPAAGRRRSVLVAQRLEREKDTDVALRAFASSRLHHQGWSLLVAGDGALRGQLEDLAARLGLGVAVEFLGHRNDVWELMRTSAVLLAPRRDEAFGLSVVEAMARGLPVVAAGSGAHLETVGSVPGAALFAPGDAEAAGRALEQLASSESTREQYGAQLQAAQRDRFTVEQQARRTEAVYREVM